MSEATIKYITAPLSAETIKDLHAGDVVRISGYIYTARDAAHKRMTEALAKGEQLPFDVRDQVIYYVGPSPAKPGEIVGSAGPTTSGRMDKYTPTMIEQGMRGMIGKGLRSQEVIDACVIWGLRLSAVTKLKIFLQLSASTAKAMIFTKSALPSTAKSNKFNKYLRGCSGSLLFFTKTLTSLFS